MEARLIALEDRLRQTEEVLVAERFARQTAEAAQQPAGSFGGGERPPELPRVEFSSALLAGERISTRIPTNIVLDKLPLAVPHPRTPLLSRICFEKLRFASCTSTKLSRMFDYQKSTKHHLMLIYNLASLLQKKRLGTTQLEKLSTW